MDNGKVSVTAQGGIATISFFHPQSNSLPGALLRELGDTITQVSSDPAAVVIVLRSEGEKAFCAGASFDELIAIEYLEGGTRFFSGFAHVINAMRKSTKLIIGRIHNKAVGGGVGLAQPDTSRSTANRKGNKRRKPIKRDKRQYKTTSLK